MLFVVLQQAVGIFAHAEKVRLFFGGLYLSAAVGALAVFQLRRRPERLAGGAVHPLVGALIDIAVCQHLFKHLLHLALVVGVGGADELVVRDIHHIPDGADLFRHAVYERLGRNARGGGLFFYLLAVLVGARLKAHVIPLRPLEPRDGVCQNDLVGVADVRLARGVGDGRGDVIRGFFCHGSLLKRSRLSLFQYYTLFFE